ncbi:MAG: histidine kinase [Chitinophagaceae bacterium]|nr:histidine kinase [Chitinophagaceae bacterium]
MISEIKKMGVMAGCLLLLISAVAQVSEYHLQLFDYPSGIRPDEVQSMGKDEKGLLWIQYRSLVQSFDGKEVQNYRPAGRVNSLLCDKEGKIWVCSEEKVFLFSERTGAFIPVDIDAPGDGLKIGPVTELPDRRIWMLTSDGFFQFDKVKQRFTRVKTMFSAAHELNTNICRLFGNVIFVHGKNFIYRYHINTGNADSASIGRIYGVFPVSEDSLLVSMDDFSPRWYCFSTNRFTEASLGNNIRGSFSFRDMTAISKTHFLIGSSEGIFKYDTEKKQFLNLNFFLNGRKVATREYARSIFYDEEEGYVWIASTDGIVRFALMNPSMALIKISQMDEEVSVDVNDIRRMVEDEKGRIWLATGYGFVCWEKKENKWILFPPAKDDNSRLSHESIRGLVYDGRYLILGPTNKGVWLFDINTHQYRRPVYDSEDTRRLSETDFIYNMTTLRNGDHIITAARAVYVLDGKTYRMRLLNYPGIHKGAASFCAQGSDGIVWVATSSGVYCFDAALNYLLTVPRAFSGNLLTLEHSGFMLPDNHLLLSGAGGLYTLYYKDGEVISEKLTDIFDDINLYTLYQDGNGIIWASSENGIYRFDPQTLKLNLFDRSDNVQGYGFNCNAWFRDKEGFLYFGGLNGMNYWRPETFSYPSQSFDAYISKVRIGGKTYSMYAFDSVGPISYSDRSIGVVFSAVYFNNPDKVKFRYRLNGRDEDWKETGSGSIVSFSSLAPGSYVLEMEASLNQVDWISANNTLAFRILNPFWMTWWFIVLCIVLAGVVTMRIIFNHQRKINRHKEELETAQSVNHIASAIYEAPDIESFLPELARLCKEKLHFKDCIIYTTDRETGLLHQKGALLAGRVFDRGNGIHKAGEIAERVAYSGRAEVNTETAGDVADKEKAKVMLSEVAVPVIIDGNVWGVIYGGHTKKGFFSQKHLPVLTTIASLCANKIIKAKADREKAMAESVLVDTRQKMAEAEMQALRAQMNPHFIFNSLNSINRYIVKSDQVTASLYLTRFARLIRLILDNSNNKTVTLASELEALKLYIEMESIRFEKKFTWHVDVPPDVYPESIYVPPLLMQPYVENAIWHGLLHKTTAGYLWVRISRKGSDLLQCVIQDNGVGRKKANELKNKTISSRKSMGMQLTESRLMLMGHLAGSNASVDIEDLADEHGAALGTRVTLNIPVDEF